MFAWLADRIRWHIQGKKANHIIEIEQEARSLKVSMDKDFAKLRTEISQKLSLFHQDVASRYFERLEKLIRFKEEITLIDEFVDSMKNKDLNALKCLLKKPVLADYYKHKEKEAGEKVDELLQTKGHKLVEMRKTLHEEMLMKGRSNQTVIAHKAKIELLDIIIGSSK